MGVRGKGVGDRGWRFGVGGWRFEEATAGAMGATWAERPPQGKDPSIWGLRQGECLLLLASQWGLFRTVAGSGGLPARDRTSLAHFTAKRCANSACQRAWVMCS